MTPCLSLCATSREILSWLLRWVILETCIGPINLPMYSITINFSFNRVLSVLSDNQFGSIHELPVRIAKNTNKKPAINTKLSLPAGLERLVEPLI